MHLVKISLKLLISLIVFTLCILAAAHFTGYDKRTYTVLKATDLGYKYASIEKMAQQYEPEMYLRPSTQTPPLMWVWYEATPTDSTIDITYHYTWEDEINPNKFFHVFYSIYRAAYFGYPLYDIEYFQINVSKRTGLVQGIRFETSPSNDFYPSVVKHIKVSINRHADGNYYNGNKIVVPIFDTMHVKAGVQTWNHLSCLIDSNSRSAYSQLLVAPLKYLADNEFSHYKFVRKSQGEH